MNTPGAGPVTTLHLILIAILAVLTIAMIARGVMLKRRRAEAQRVQDEAIETQGTSTPTQRQADAPPSPVLAPAVPAAAPAEPVAAPTPAVEDEVAAHATLIDEPVAAVAPFDPSPAPVAPEPAPLAPEPAVVATPPVAEPVPTEPVPTEPVVSPGEWPVTTLKGLGPKVAMMLGQHGVTTVADMAALDTPTAQAIDAQLGAFTGRMGRDRWIDQAQLLAAGDIKGFEAAFGKL